MTKRKPFDSRVRLSAEQVAMVRQWWEFRKIPAKTMCHTLGIDQRTLRDAVRCEGAYRG